MNLVVDGLLTHYTRVGQSPGAKLVLIIPGWADTSANWQAMQQQLSQAYDTVVVDLPGFGGSQAPATAWGPDEYAGFVGGFITKLGAGQPYAILGHSNGGAIAMTGLAAGTLSAARLVLVASAGIRGQEAGRKQALKLLAKTGKVLSAPLPARLRKRLRSKLYSAAGSDMLVAEHMQESFKKVVSADVQAAAGQLTLPTLLVYGDRDDATPLSYGQTFQGLIEGSRLEIVPGAGHFVFLDQPDKVGILVQEFLR